MKDFVANLADFSANLNEVALYMEQKGIEYRTIDKSRSKRIYAELQPHLKSPKHIIQVLGTNGKGSTGRFIAQILAQNGCTILHFTSPHIFSFNERFYTNLGQNLGIISDKSLIKAHRFLQGFEAMRECSYFEYATFLALVLAQGVDYLILEAGVGGELDSTSVVKRDLCVFSVIDYDHTEILGDSIESIATTKLNAVFYPNKVPKMVLGVQKYAAVEKIAKDIAKKHSVEMFCVDCHDLQVSLAMTIESYLARHNLAPFLAQNLALALKATQIFGINADLDSLPKLDLHGRFEQIEPNITIDVGHNQNAAFAIKRNLNDKKIILVYNSYFQKNIFEILSILKDNILRVEILSVSDNPRIIEQSKLEQILDSLQIAHKNFTHIDSKQDYLVFGSFSVVEAFMRQFLSTNQSGANQK